MEKKQNIVLIGMSGAGKSTLGVLLAKAAGLRFVDTDLVIQQRENRLLQQIIEQDGNESFIKAEQSAILSLELEGYVIATGGSAVYSELSMRHLKKGGTVVFLHVPFSEIEKRLVNVNTRGIVFRGGKNLRDIYDERLKLYEEYADIIINCSDFSVEENVRKILELIK